MTAHPDLQIDELRHSIIDGLQRAVDGLPGGYAAPLRRQLRTETDDFDAATLCLGLGRIAGQETKTLPCALTLGLLEEMGRVFLGLEDGSSVIGAWGMPRTLNAADGLYTLGRHLLLSHEALDATTRLRALSIHTDAARAFSEALHAYASEGDAALPKASRSLFPAAAAFAALCGGLGDDVKAEFEAAATAGSVEAALVRAAALPLRKP
ncbi:MAG TPA: hypothetical protein VFS30_14490 [Dehalococcoidia bacterium]|nr:hypothetical protein [Dehalococcoidia bacterium]